MTKRRVKNQIPNLTPDHYESGITLIYLRGGGVTLIVGKLLTRATTFLEISPQLKVCKRSYGLPKVLRVPISRISRISRSQLGSPGIK